MQTIFTNSCGNMNDRSPPIRLNSFQPIAAFHTKTSQLFALYINKMTGFYMAWNTRLKWVQLRTNTYTNAAYVALNNRRTTTQLLNINNFEPWYRLKQPQRPKPQSPRSKSAANANDVYKTLTLTSINPCHTNCHIKKKP